MGTLLGAGFYYEDIDRYVRNQLAEAQITEDAAQYIPNYVHPDDETMNLIGSRIKGTFLSDSTHPFATPDDLTYLWNVCCVGNAMMGMYDAWKTIIEYKGGFAQVNLLLNRSSRYLDIKSELPYQGAVHFQTKADLGPIVSLGVRIPEWADRAQVQVLLNGQPLGGWQWIAAVPQYLQIDGLQPSAVYTVVFPVVVRQLPITVLRTQAQMWLEANLPTLGEPFAVTTLTGTFRGNTLVDVDQRPTGGIPRYQRQDLASLPGSNTPAPWSTRPRFAAERE